MPIRNNVLVVILGIVQERPSLVNLQQMSVKQREYNSQKQGMHIYKRCRAQHEKLLLCKICLTFTST